MNVVMLGLPGAGKGTQSKRIAMSRGLRHISTGDLLRSAKQQDTSLGRQIAERIDAGDFVSDELAISLVEEAMQPPSAAGHVFDGIPRTIGQDRLLTGLLERSAAKIDLVIQLEVDEATARTRMLERAVTESRGDDTVEAIDRRIAVYESETAPLIDHYRQLALLRSIDGTGTPDEVFALVEAALDETAIGEPTKRPSDS